MADTHAPNRVDDPVVVLGTSAAGTPADVSELLAALRLQAQLFARWAAGEFLRATDVHDSYAALERAYAALAGDGHDGDGADGRHALRIGRAVRRVGRIIDRIVVEAQLTGCPPDSTMSRMSTLACDAVVRLQQASRPPRDEGSFEAIAAARASLTAMERAHDQAGHRIAVTGEVRTLADRLELYRLYEDLAAAIDAMADRLALPTTGQPTTGRPEA